MTTSPVGPRFGNIYSNAPGTPMLTSGLAQAGPALQFGSAADTVTVAPARVRELCVGSTMEDLTKSIEEQVDQYKDQKLKDAEKDALVSDIVQLARLHAEYGTIAAADDAVLGGGASFYKDTANDYREVIEEKIRVLTQDTRNSNEPVYIKRRSLYLDPIIARVDTRVGHLSDVDDIIRNKIAVANNPLK